MKGKRFKDEQIIRILHEAEAGLSVSEEMRQPRNLEQLQFSRAALAEDPNQ